METEISRQSYGSQWEEELFGVSAGNTVEEFPRYLGKKASIQEIMWMPLERVGESGQLETYDPENPNWGSSRQLWFEIKRNLPIRVRKEFSYPLALYIACRPQRTSLDFWHGVDAFFFWEGVCVTIDASLYKTGGGKANFIVTPNEMSPARLASFGKQIAQALKEKRKRDQRKVLSRKKLRRRF